MVMRRMPLPFWMTRARVDTHNVKYCVPKAAVVNSNVHAFVLLYAYIACLIRSVFVLFAFTPISCVLFFFLPAG